LIRKFIIPADEAKNADSFKLQMHGVNL